MASLIQAIKNLLHAANLRHGTDGFTSSPKEGVLTIFSSSASVRFEPANLGTKGQHATPRPPKPLSCIKIINNINYYMLHANLLMHSEFPLSFHICDKKCIANSLQLSKRYFFYPTVTNNV